MALTLQKGQNLSLSKVDPGLVKALLGLGWDPRPTDGQEFDLDASAILLNKEGKVRSNADFVFYNQMGDVTLANDKDFDPNRASVMYQGDNRDGEGDGDDEQVHVDLSKIPADVDRIVFTVSIFEADVRNQNFGQVRNAFIRIENLVTGNEIVRYDLSEDYASETALIFAELYRYNGEWKFKAVGQGFYDGLGGIARSFGINI